MKLRLGLVVVAAVCAVGAGAVPGCGDEGSSSGGGACEGAFYRDADGDGFGAGEVTRGCAPPAGFVATGGDCDEGRVDVHPGAALQDGIDANCDGVVDFDVDGDGTSDRTPAPLDFDPTRQRHVELAEVVAGAPFTVEVHDGEIAPEGVKWGGSPLAKALAWDPARRALSGRIRDPGVYRFPLSVCRVTPFDAAACERPENRRLDLAHLTVRPPRPLGAAPDPGPRGPHRAILTRVDVDVSGVLAAAQIGQLPSLADSEPTPERQAILRGLGSVSPARLIYPGQSGGEAAAPGKFPLVVILHGNGYHWDDYDQLGSQLASHGMVVIVPQYVNGFLGACGAGSEQRVLFGQRAMNHALALSKTAGALLEGRLDPAQVVLVGHSWGGAAAEWAMPVFGARQFVIFDPIGLLNNVGEWKNCNVDMVTGTTVRDHLRPSFRDVSAPVLLFDSGRSGFVATLGEYRGLFPHSPVVHVSTQGTLHEDFLDAEEAQRWLSAGTCFDAARLAAHKDAVTSWMTRVVRRYAGDDLAFDPLVHGPAALRLGEGVFPGQVFVATHRPSASARPLDMGASFAFGSPHTSPRANLAGGTTVAVGDGAGIALSPAAEALVSRQPDGGLNVFGQATLDFLRSDAQPAFRKVVVSQSSGPAVLREDFPTPLDASEHDALAVEIVVAHATTGLCHKGEPDDSPLPLGAVVRLVSADGRQVGISGSALTGADRVYHQVPLTLMASLASVAARVDLRAIRTVEVEVPPGPSPRVVAFDDLRLLR